MKKLLLLLGIISISLTGCYGVPYRDHDGGYHNDQGHHDDHGDQNKGHDDHHNSEDNH
ncbi:hypothetical protein [Sulfuriferula nivalis]|uniref:Lipoprotein n=1 Tax=Sulfuriferula nivalis TaxID=2675298 RepID=A0A809RH79_9PROT|nr:hypothetical protein [Sulfuriferula nivalis]BBP00986.1 hypothetical protein SFSGTM_16940 [Sulfuriferula nivalis]